MSGHTPMPWRVSSSDPKAIRRNARFIAESQREEDTQFIVRAVNAHDDLVAALKPLAAFYERHFGGSQWQDHESHWVALDGLNVGDIRRAHAALAKATQS